MMLVGAAGFVLLIVSASVANLLLARLVRREREMSIRAALGAGRWRLFRQLLTESTVLSVIGGIVGLVLASVSLNLLVSFADRFTTRSDEIGINGTVLLFTLAIAVGTGMIVGVIPALPTKTNLASGIQEGGRTVGGGRTRFRSALIVIQVAVSFVLLIGAGLMLRSLLLLQAVDPGIQTDSVMTMRVALNFTKYTEPRTDSAVSRGPARQAASTARGAVGRRELRPSRSIRVAPSRPGSASRVRATPRPRVCREPMSTARRPAISRPSASRCSRGGSSPNMTTRTARRWQ